MPNWRDVGYRDYSDPRLQPPEPVLMPYMCDYCGDYIEQGQDIVKSNIGITHYDCWEDFVWDECDARRLCAGEDED